MLQHQTTYFLVLLAACAIDGAIALQAYRQQKSDDHGFAVLMAAAFLYALGYAFALVSMTIPARLFWARLEFLGLVALPPAWVMTAASYVTRSHFLTRRLAGTLFLIPAVSLLLYYTNSYHHLYYGTVSLIPPGPLALISAAKGPWYWVFATYACMSFLFGSLLYSWKRRRERGARRQQTGLLLAGSLLPWVAVLAYPLGANALGMDLGPLALTGAGLVFGWIILGRTGLTPISRAAVFQGVREGVLVLDSQNRIVDFNPAARSIIANLTPQALGRPAEESLQDHPELLRQVLSPDCRQVELQLPLGKGLKCYQSRLSPLVNRHHQPIGKAVILYDVTQHTWRVDELQTKARIDPLTGIFNRRYLLEFGRQEIEGVKRRGRPVSVVLLDIDHFKVVNDTHGHSAGDLALKNVVRTCAGALRSRDLLGRWGGEEFVIILPGAAPDGALLVAERVRKDMADSPVVLDDSTTINLTASFGVAGVEASGPDTSLEDLLEMADQALYRAKNTGRNRVVLARDKPQPSSSTTSE
ncbi:MAG TPA: diguanylate cyclase [Spirochaetia bacterium]|nr:diguanylate cyclase [Spirochaetia bacterium]